MAEGEDGQERTEEPTQKRRDDARSKGQVLTSRELFVFTTTLGGAGILYAATLGWQWLVALWGAELVLPAGTDLDPITFARLKQAGTWLFISGLALGLPLIGVILATQMASGGLVFSTQALGFKFEKLNPMAGFGRMFSMRSIVELGKAILKTGLILSAAILALMPQLDKLVGSGAMATGDALVLVGATLARVGFAMMVALAIVAGADLAWQIVSMRKKLMMSRQEIKDEFKESEGSPELKGAIRRRQLEASRGAKERKALEDVPTATAIVTNPTHFAVALRYDPGTSDAPVIVAMGRGGMALQVIDRADTASVPRIEAPPLARALYYGGDLGGPIPFELYNAVAILLAHVWRLDRGMDADLPDIDIPDPLRFDANGNLQTGDMP